MNLIFLHTPKAAGGTFTRYLSRQAKLHELSFSKAFGHLHVHKRAESKLSSLDRLGEVSKAQILTGHLPWGVHELVHMEPNYIVILREPISRIVSHLNFWQERGKISTGENPVDVVDDIIDNIQTRQLAGLDGFEGPCNEMMFMRAVKNLYAARFVGVQSDLQRVEAHMEAAFGWAPVSIKNVHVPLKPMFRFIDDELFRKIYHRESFDARLFNIASKLAAQ
jgi:hypothetical protein